MCHQTTYRILRPSTIDNYLRIIQHAQRTDSLENLPTRSLVNTPTYQLAVMERQTRQLGEYLQNFMDTASETLESERVGESSRSVQVRVEEVMLSESSSIGQEEHLLELEGAPVEEQRAGGGANDLQVFSMRFDPHAPFSAGSDLLNELNALWDRNYSSAMGVFTSLSTTLSSSRRPLTSLPLNISQQIFEMTRIDLPPSPPASEDGTASNPIRRLLPPPNRDGARSRSQSSTAAQLPRRSRFDFTALMAEADRRRQEQELLFPERSHPSALDTDPPTPQATPEEGEERHFPTVNEAGPVLTRQCLPTVDELINDQEAAWEALMRMPEPGDENGERCLPTVDEVICGHDRSWDRFMRVPELSAAPLPAQQPASPLKRAWEEVSRMPSPLDENRERRLPTVDELLRDHDRSWDRFMTVSRSGSAETSSSRQEYVDSSETETEDEAEDIYRPPAPHRQGYEGTGSSETDSDEESLYPRTEDSEVGYLSSDTLIEDENTTRDVRRHIRAQRRLHFQRSRLARRQSSSVVEGEVGTHSPYQPPRGLVRRNRQAPSRRSSTSSSETAVEESESEQNPGTVADSPVLRFGDFYDVESSDEESSEYSGSEGEGESSQTSVSSETRSSQIWRGDRLS